MEQRWRGTTRLELLREHNGGRIADSLFHRCFKFLRPSLPRPAGRMVKDDVLLSTADTHEAWRRQLMDQGGDLADVSSHKRKCTTELASQRELRARTEIGLGALGRHVNEGDIASEIGS